MPSRDLQLLEQVKDLALDGDIERGRRFVGDQQLRVAGERHGDHDALAHAAGKLVRIGAQRACGRRNAHEVEQLDCARCALRRGSRLRCLRIALHHLFANR